MLSVVEGTNYFFTLWFITMYRVPVVSKSGKPLMPTKPSRARRWLKEGKAQIYRNDLQQFAIQLTVDADTKVTELTSLFPISSIVYEYVKAIGDKGFSPAMVGQKVMITEWLPQLAPVITRYGWETSNLREYLRLEKDKSHKSNQTPATHAVDGVTLAAHHFLKWREFKGRSGHWSGTCELTPAPFLIVRRPPVSRRQLHLMVFAKGGIRRKYGGTVTRHSFRKGDFVETERKGLKYRGWVSGDTKTQVSVSDFNWKQLGQFSAKKTKLLKRSTRLICKPLVTGAAFLPSLKARVSCREDR